MKSPNPNREIATETNRPSMLPPVDVVEDANGITLVADLPGVGKEQLSLRVDGDQLSIDAELSLPSVEGMTPLHAEVARRRYQRTFTLSKELDAAQVSAELTQGVLRVRIPKVAFAQPRRVEVRVS